ncbi:reverse transcriptase domain-containing protein [Tanacetum coccineum]
MVSDVKSLMQLRSVSKPWKSFIDSSDFIKGYGARHTQPHSHILRYKSGLESTDKYIYLVDDDIETFKVQQKEFDVSPLLKQYPSSFAVGACHGLLCLFAFCLCKDGNNKGTFACCFLDRFYCWVIGLTPANDGEVDHNFQMVEVSLDLIAKEF